MADLQPEMKSSLMQHEDRIAVEAIIHESGHAVASRYLGEPIRNLLVMVQLPGGWSEVYRLRPASPLHECIIALAGAIAHEIFFGTKPVWSSWKGDRKKFLRHFKELPEYKPSLRFLRSDYPVLWDRTTEILSQPECQHALAVLAAELVKRMNRGVVALSGTEVEKVVDPVLQHIIREALTN